MPTRRRAAHIDACLLGTSAMGLQRRVNRRRSHSSTAACGLFRQRAVGSGPQRPQATSLRSTRFRSGLMMPTRRRAGHTDACLLRTFMTGFQPEARTVATITHPRRHAGCPADTSNRVEARRSADACPSASEEAITRCPTSACVDTSWFSLPKMKSPAAVRPRGSGRDVFRRVSSESSSLQVHRWRRCHRSHRGRRRSTATAP